MMLASHPILSCEESGAFEARLFGGDEAAEWPAMQRAGRAVAAAVLWDFEEIGGFPPAGRVLVLVGKGHNGGDALIAAQAVLAQFPAARAEVVFVFGERALRPLAARAWRELTHAVGERVVVGREADLARPATSRAHPFALCIDGVFGFQFRRPALARVAALIANVNALPVRLRAAVDLPSAGLFRADFTYATGIVKTPVLAEFGAHHRSRVLAAELLNAKRRHGVLRPVANPTVGEIARTCIQSYGIFPNWVSQLTEFVLGPLLFWPNGVNKCRIECWTIAPDWGDGEGPDYWTVNRGESLCEILLEDTEFGTEIQKSMESPGFKGVPLSYQEARIYHWNQHADCMIGLDSIPPELAVEQVINEDWVYPNDPRLEQITN